MKLETAEKLLKRIRRELRLAYPAEAERMKDWHPVIELALIAANPAATLAIKFTASEAVARYTVPKPAQVDMAGNVAPRVEVVIAGYAQPQRDSLPSRGAPAALSSPASRNGAGEGPVEE